MSDFSFVVVMIPAVGALVIAIAALRSKARASYGGAASDVQTEAGRIAESETEASPFRGIAGIFAVCAFVAVCCLSLFGRSLSLKISSVETTAARPSLF